MTLFTESGARRSASTSPSRQALLGVGLGASPASRDRASRSEHVSPLHTPHLASSEPSPPLQRLSSQSVQALQRAGSGLGAGAFGGELQAAPMRTRGGSLALERELDRRLVRQKTLAARQGTPSGFTHLSELNSQVRFLFTLYSIHLDTIQFL